MALQNQLKTLEQELHQLLAVMTQLVADNHRLEEREQQLMADCERLQHKSRIASQQVEEILAALKRPAPVNPIKD